MISVKKSAQFLSHQSIYFRHPLTHKIIQHKHICTVWHCSSIHLFINYFQ